jgi:hypothetical protein
MRASTLGTCTRLFVILTAVTLLAGLAAAGTNGAIYTTTSTATTVNGNIYTNKADVYLSGGPQNSNAAGLSPDGAYYFQVTDPSGALLLSTEDIKCRVVQVTGGVVSGVPSDDAGGFGTPGCYHSPGSFNAANGVTPVQLCNRGGVCPTGLPSVKSPPRPTTIRTMRAPSTRRG